MRIETGVRRLGIAAAMLVGVAAVLMVIEGSTLGALSWIIKPLFDKAAAELASGALVGAGTQTLDIPVEIRMYRQRAVMSDKAEALWALAQQQALD